MIVIDACILTKLYFDEEGSENARQELEEHGEIKAPALIRMEVSSAISRKFRTGQISESEARLVYARWKKQSRERWITLIPDDDVMDEAMALSIKLKHPLPDCIYLAVAARLKLPLLTADRTFFRRAHSHYKKLRLLGES